MEHLNSSLFLLVIPSVLCVLSIVVVMLVKKENRLLSQQLTETTVSLELTRKQFAELEEKHTKIKEFQSSLQVAELTTKFQKPRLNKQSIDTDSSTPEKYRYFQSLARKGMSTEEIASVLDISTHEANQLVSLSRIAQGQFAESVAG